LQSVMQLVKAGTIGAVTFDLDDTLWSIWPIIERAEQRLHAWLEVYYPRLCECFTPLDLRQIACAVEQQQPHIAHDRTLLRKETLRLAAVQANCAEFDVEAAFEVFYQARNEVIFFDDALPALERLRQRYILGALSNGNADIRRIGLDHVFAFALSAIDVGAAKPEPILFEAACRQLNLPPERIVHVGDDPVSDVRGAAQAGMRTVWVNRDNRDWPGGARADAEITTLTELEPLLARWHAD